MNKFFGLDVGNHSIKALMLGGNPGRYKVLGYAYGSTPSGIPFAEDEASQRNLASSIKDIIGSSNLSKVKGCVAAVPESHVFKRLLTNLPYIDEQSLGNTVMWEVKKYITTPLEDMTVDYIPIGEKTKDGMKVIDVLAVAIKNSFIERYVKILQMAGLNPMAIETEGIASVRALYPTVIDQGSSYFIVDFGSGSTDVCFAYNDKLVYSDSIAYGSDSITKAIAQTFGMDMVKAEEYKKTYGVDPQHFDGKLVNAINPVLDMILLDVRRSLEYFKKEFLEIAPKTILVTGEAAKMPGLMQYIQNKLQISVLQANPWQNIEVSENDKGFLMSYSSGFTVSIGLAMKQDIV